MIDINTTHYFAIMDEDFVVRYYPVHENIPIVCHSRRLDLDNPTNVDMHYFKRIGNTLHIFKNGIHSTTKLKEVYDLGLCMEHRVMPLPITKNLMNHVKLCEKQLKSVSE